MRIENAIIMNGNDSLRFRVRSDVGYFFKLGFSSELVRKLVKSIPYYPALIGELDHNKIRDCIAIKHLSANLELSDEMISRILELPVSEVEKYRIFFMQN